MKRTRKGTGSGAQPPRKRKGSKRVTRQELLRRLTAAAAACHETAAKALGEDLEPLERTQALVWLFSYLVGGEFAHLVVLTDEPQRAEARINAALAAGIEEYADFMTGKVPAEHQASAARQTALLNAIARRIGGPFTAGQPHLELVGDRPVEPAEAPQPSVEDALRLEP
ncbi:MAG TPA: hypothetical protein VGQ83_24920 [Polyangia bacterium]